MMKKGFVSLVGAGPGDPELLTLKGLRRLQEADVIVYDALINQRLLEMCRPDAELIDVGKRHTQHTATQEQIQTLLIERAQAGYQVVRLKGGDPFVFGRGGEEAAALQEAEIPWEIVPGISSAISVPAYAGIPLTHRAHAASFAVVTGHEDPTRSTSRIDWQALATGIDTLVFLMGVGRLEAIVTQLIAHGRPAETPAAVIHWGTTVDQRVVIGTLTTISAEVTQAKLGAPATLVIGEVVQLHKQLQWFEPLMAAEMIV